uniref:Uncharacterized protein n=1 Tax=Neisseria meningitidis alpha275 TaxID=295996 RepID=C6SMT3_NEIME|nr:hypothetical protein predicted by Glimmer/Critica [Neisseria meningitidis alpha275]
MTKAFWFDISNPSFGDAGGLRTAKLDSKDADYTGKRVQTASEHHAV